MVDPENGTTVAVTSKGQATIPKVFRKKLNFETPGLVRFGENDRGEVVRRSVKRPAEFRGAAAPEESVLETPDTELLREERQRDKQAMAERFERLDEE